jgi:hypothetical protein
MMNVDKDLAQLIADRVADSEYADGEYYTTEEAAEGMLPIILRAMEDYYEKT